MQGGHIFEKKGSISGTIGEIKKFLDLVKRTVWVSNISYQVEKVPTKYREKMGKHVPAYKALLENVAPNNSSHPFLDVWQMTHSCNMANCSYDGGHRSRYVNRWKAQLLLNTICEASDEDNTRSPTVPMNATVQSGKNDTITTSSSR